VAAGVSENSSLEELNDRDLGFVNEGCLEPSGCGYFLCGIDSFDTVPRTLNLPTKGAVVSKFVALYAP
jgi:hypothetical protein